jgi:hypothetical protein
MFLAFFILKISGFLFLSSRMWFNANLQSVKLNTDHDSIHVGCYSMWTGK